MVPSHAFGVMEQRKGQLTATVLSWPNAMLGIDMPLARRSAMLGGGQVLPRELAATVSRVFLANLRHDGFTLNTQVASREQWWRDAAIKSMMKRASFGVDEAYVKRLHVAGLEVTLSFDGILCPRGALIAALAGDDGDQIRRQGKAFLAKVRKWAKKSKGTCAACDGAKALLKHKGEDVDALKEALQHVLDEVSAVFKSQHRSISAPIQRKRSMRSVGSAGSSATTASSVIAGGVGYGARAAPSRDVEEHKAPPSRDVEEHKTLVPMATSASSFPVGTTLSLMGNLKITRCRMHERERYSTWMMFMPGAEAFKVLAFQSMLADALQHVAEQPLSTTTGAKCGGDDLPQLGLSFRLPLPDIPAANEVVAAFCTRARREMPSRFPAEGSRARKGTDEFEERHGRWQHTRRRAPGF